MPPKRRAQAALPGPTPKRQRQARGESHESAALTPGPLLETTNVASPLNQMDVTMTDNPGLPEEQSAMFHVALQQIVDLPLLKADHATRPLWVGEDGRIAFEKFSPIAQQTQDFLAAIAEPVSRPELIHEYKITPTSLYSAVSVGLQTADIITVLSRLSKAPIPEATIEFIQSYTASYGRVKLVLKDNKYYIESKDANVLQHLLKDVLIGCARVAPTETPHTPRLANIGQDENFHYLRAAKAVGSPKKALLSASPTGLKVQVDEEQDEEDEHNVFRFQIDDAKIDDVKKRCHDMNFPLLEEYDFRNDKANANLAIDLKASTVIRPYQESSLRKMFGNGRARSGIIVLPCGAGKTLVGVTAACTIRKSCLVLCTSAVSALQWQQQFELWSTVNSRQISIFTSERKEKFATESGILISTYSMIANTRKRSREAERVMEFITSREWGLVLLDEVHVVPATTFRRVFSNIKAHAKLGLTATLVREDDKICDLNYMIGPKLYEANWKDLATQGHIANVLCAEVLCPMTTEFYAAYLQASERKKTLLYCMNPTKLQACQYLINYHEAKGDKIIVFSDNIFALMYYARKLGKPFICGDTSQAERRHMLQRFKHDPGTNTIFLSKVGDTSLDIPEATCLIQISSHFGSRRQEAQRLGRILRARRRSEEGFNAYFYSLVSTDTAEMYFSTKRQQFLVDQGYAFKVTPVAHFEDMESILGSELVCRSAGERDMLLRDVLSVNEKQGETGADDKEILEVD